MKWASEELKPSSSPSGSMCQQDMSIWLVSTEGRRLLIGWSLGESGPGGSIRADTVNTELRRVDRSLTNSHQPTGTLPLTQRLPAIPYCQAGVWVKGCGVWWYWSLDETLGPLRGNCIGDKFTIGVRVIFLAQGRKSLVSGSFVEWTWCPNVLKKYTDHCVHV